MATRSIALAALIATACSPIADRCKSGTLLVTVTLAGATASADQLVVDVSLDGGAAHESVLSHAPGHPAGNVVVQFPSGYPRGHRVTVTLSASANGALLGSASADATLADVCAVAAITVDTGGADLSTAATGDDLATSDDLARAGGDMATGPDMTGCTATENCFNGIDDDCNGKTDCDDPNCAPTAICVPAATAPFGYITQEPFGGSCASDATSGGTLYASNPGGGGCNAASCGCNDSGCSTLVRQWSDGCPGTVFGSFSATVGNTCSHALNGLNNLDPGSPSGTLSCATTGSATPVNPPVMTKALRCDVTNLGHCTVANTVCVPRSSSVHNQCIIASGAQTCPSGYPNGASWYASYTDNRACSCVCSATSCANSTLQGFNSSQCGVVGAPSGACIASNDYQWWKLAGACSPSTTLGGTTIAFNGMTTVCCE